ncbi:MAG: hypothetical protein GX344_10270 [Intrasporangiaceae bacterium]|nr:hypothetical protein [Intrasporangiaceae bacterium]
MRSAVGLDELWRWATSGSVHDERSKQQGRRLALRSLTTLTSMRRPRGCGSSHAVSLARDAGVTG